MKKTIPVVLLSLLLSFSAAAEEKKGCDVDEIKDSPNPIISILSFPMKLVTAITFGPRCLISSIPKNK